MEITSNTYLSLYLEKFKVIEENFLELCNDIYIPTRKDYSFRIKKLGKHRAAGVFFPFYKTTIFDLNHPNAFTHELWHQIDAIMAEGMQGFDYFSETLEFRQVFNRYKELITKHVESLPINHKFRQQWNGKTKYNKSYFLKPTEVLARSGEVYVASLGINNSLTQSKAELEQAHEYSFDSEYVESVKKFFEKLVTRLKEKESINFLEDVKEFKKELRPVQRVAKEWNLLEETSEFKQMSLF